MDIQKEREAFVAWFKSLNENGRTTYFLGQESTVAWEAWQAAKAQFIPDGFVLVPKEPTPKMIDATWNYDDEIQDMSHNTRNEFIYKAMIEAQEQSQ